jgi:hypothetical protein
MTAYPNDESLHGDDDESYDPDDYDGWYGPDDLEEDYELIRDILAGDDDPER